MTAKRTIRKFAGIAGLALAGGVVGVFVGKGVAALGWLRDSLDVLSAWDLLVLPLAWLLVIAVHEGGHLAGGLSRGMRFLLMIIGPLGWVRAGERIEFRLYFNLGTLGGVAAAMPVPDRPLLPQLRRLVVGGPLASLLLAVLCAAVFVFAEGRTSAYALITGLLSALIFVATAVPMRAGGFMSDGMQFLQLSRDPAMVERRAHLIGLVGMSLAGRRPRELDPELLAQTQALAGDEPLFDVGVWQYSAHHAWDQGDLDAAGTWLDRIANVFDQYPDGFRQSVAVELALHAAWHRRDLATAEGWLARAKGGVVDATRRALAEAAVAQLRGDAAKAATALATARRKLAHGMDPGVARLSADQIEALQSRTADTRQGPPSA
ncbi:site-2 protease family protein [Arenimonas sp.]|uniref:site-2 protease family protein n=1 Tax=Arenimonas sp. TaxID=1872635 RepID=UPI0025BB2192|nr:site-2 protease family protein [Arenimonas sp.]